MKAPTKIKVLVVDDSYFMRKLLREMLERDPRIRVVGSAKNGVEAVAEALRLKPNVITMDFNMPRMNGAQAVAEILSDCRLDAPAIIMLSAYTKEGAQQTLASLRAGAIDFIAKPSGELSLDLDKIEDDLVRKIYVASRAVVRRHPQARSPVQQVAPARIKAANKLVVIGASTGGPPIVEDLLMELPVDFPAAVLVVQHMPEYFIEKFSERLNKLTPFIIKEATQNEVINAGDVLIAPGDRFVGIQSSPKSGRHLVKLVTSGKDQKGLTSIDHAMVAAAKSFGENTIGVILTGMGEDGKAGITAIKKAGGYTIAQDIGSAAVSSMPLSVIQNNLAKEVLVPAGIAKRIVELCQKD